MNADKSGTRTNGANSGSRASNWNNYPWNSNWNIGLRAASAKRKIARYRRVGDDLALSRFVASWRGHAQWANSFNLLNRLGVA